jgi:hypothetical protein
MGCTHSRNDHVMRCNSVEFSATELSIAKRPGGPDVGPIHVAPTTGASEVEAEPAPAAATLKRLPVGEMVFFVVKVVADADGVMFYHFAGTSAMDPRHEVRIAKRYSDFKALHAEISELMANERNVPLEQQHLFHTHPALPELPRANAWTYLLGRYNEKLLEEREEQFTKILNAISRHPVASQSKPFADFLLA